MQALWSHFEIVPPHHHSLSLDKAMAFVSDERFGGYAFFVGRIRNHSGGKMCIGVDYETHKPLADNRMSDFFSALASERPDLKVYASHAEGALKPGDIAVVVACGAKHRAEAFSTCRAVIEHVKHALPIWKREHFDGGHSAWAEGCSLCHP